MKPKQYAVYEGIENKKKIYVTVSADVYPDDAIRIANQHFKLNKLCLQIEAGYTKGKDLYIGYSDDKRTKPVWVVSIREKGK